MAQIYRLEKGVKYPDFFTKGSYCEECDKQLTWYELIPVLSYLFTRGKCQRCGYKVSVTYPIFEFILGINFVTFFLIGVPVISYFIAVALYFLALYDFYYSGFPKFIMNSYLIIALVFAIVTLVVDFSYASLYAFAVAASISVGFLILNRIKESFGLGDILVFLFLGLLLPVDQLLITIFLSIVFGAIGGIILILLRKANRKSKIPFVPFIYTGYVTSFLVGGWILDYFGLIGSIYL